MTDDDVKLELEDGWRDLSTAPKLGQVIVFDRQWGVCEAVRFDDGHWGLATFNGQIKEAHPEAWQPMPSAPGIKRAPSSSDGRMREALQAAQQIVDAIAAIKGKRLAIAFRDDATAQHVGMILENAAKVSRALLNRPNSSSPDGRAWQAIDTAPKDGTDIDLWCRSYRTTDARWALRKDWHRRPLGEGWCVAHPEPPFTQDGEEYFGFPISNEPTHWMPLPSPPIEPVAAVAEQGPPSNGGTPNSHDGRMREALEMRERCAMAVDELHAELEALGKAKPHVSLAVPLAAFKEAAIAIRSLSVPNPNDGRMREALEGPALAQIYYELERARNNLNTRYLNNADRSAGRSARAIMSALCMFDACRAALSPNSEPVHNPDSPKPLSDKDAFDIQPKDRADG